MASPQGRQLASWLSAAPVITMPVVRLIQETLLGERQPVQVAEVFLSGLLQPLSRIEPETNPDEVQYDFATAEIRDIFLAAAPQRSSLTVLEKVSRYVAQQLGVNLIEFNALLRKPTEAAAKGFDARAFARIQVQVLKRLGGEYVQLAQELEAQAGVGSTGSESPADFNWQELEVEVAQITVAGDKERLLSWEFETFFVDARGREIRRQQCRADYYDEILDVGAQGLRPQSQSKIQNPKSKIRMIAIPAGEFWMGSPTEEKGRYDDESPQHPVKVSPFFISQTPITQLQWRFVASLPQERRELKLNPANDGDDFPVRYVSWYDAIEFCARLSRYTGRNYRLPSEAEWEYACRAVSSYQLLKDATRPKKKRRNSLVSGEWCLDPWHGNYAGAPGDGRVWDEQNKNENHYQNILENLEELLKNDRNRVIRGGSWSYVPWDCRSAYRHDFNPDSDAYNSSFRVVCVPPRTL
jgi:formylglycine-generating enzyme required for sulfatase activity